MALASAAAGVFTQNSFQAAPVQVSKKMLLQYPNEISAVIVNSGCANACTADQGVKDAQVRSGRSANCNTNAE